MAIVNATPVYLEVGTKRVFACSLDWPGWCRSGRTDELALEALGAYVPRYSVVAAHAGVEFQPSAGDNFDVVERVPGSATTDFGAPGAVPAVDARSASRADASRLAVLVDASWKVLDQVVAGAPDELRKGPRGGGRNRDKIVTHVLDAESAYARKIGLKIKPAAFDDVAEIAARRAQILTVLGEPSDGSPLAERGCPLRYAARRIAWHILDHAWEIEDRSSS